MKKEKKLLTREDFVQWGKKSGNKNKTKGKEYFSEIGRKGALKRWANKKK